MNEDNGQRPSYRYGLKTNWKTAIGNPVMEDIIAEYTERLYGRPPNSFEKMAGPNADIFHDMIAKYDDLKNQADYNFHENFR